jgi:PAS domain S-box-containing protein
MMRIFQPKFLIPIGILVLVFCVSFALSLSHRNMQRSQLNQESRLFRANFATRLGTHLDAYLNAVMVLGAEFESVDPRDPEAFRAETQFVHDLFDNIQALNWVDTDGIIRTVTPLIGNEAALGLDLNRLDIPREAMAKALLTNHMHVTRPLTLAQGGTGFVIYLPLTYNGEPAGMLNAVFRSDTLIASTLNAFEAGRFHLTIADSSDIFFADVETNDPATVTSVPDNIAVGNRTWQIYATPNPVWRQTADQMTDEAILYAGATIAVVLATLSHLLLDRQQSLRISQTRLRDFAVSSSDWFWEMDQNLRFCWFSEGVRDALGVPVDHFLGKTRSDFLHPSHDNDAAWDAHLASLEAHQPFKNFEYSITVNGEEKWLRVSGVPAFDSVGKFTGYRGIASHITETVQAKRAAEVANQMLADSVEGMSELFSLWDQEDRLVFGNRQFRLINHDVPHVLVPGTRFEDFIRAGAEAGHMPDMTLAIDDFIAQSVKRRYAPNPQPFEVHRRGGQILRLHEQQLSNGCIATVGKDVTEQVKSAQALRASEERLALAVEQVSIWDWDLTRKELYLSPGFAETLGYTAEEYYALARESYLSLIHPDERERFHQSVIAHLKTPSVALNTEQRLRTKSGEYRWFLARGHAVRGNDKRAVRSVGVLSDITDRITLEDKLHQAQKMDAIGQLTGGVAHDFNNLLAVILGNIELISDLIEDETVSPLMNAIMRSAQRGADLTQRLLAFSRRQPLRPSNVDIVSLLAGLPDLIHPVLGETISLDLNADSETWTALADEGQIENALLNLALNARDAMPDGGALCITSSNETIVSDQQSGARALAPGDYVVLKIIDNGTGMSQETLEHAFEPFFTTKGVGQGSGLGLSMVLGFAQQSGGAARIESALGSGTTITLYLPRAGAELPKPAASTSPPVPKGQGEIILVIEDDPALRALTKKMLKRQGYDVITAQDAQSARTTLAKTPEVSLILSDVVLPGGTSGPDFIDSILDSHPRIKTVFMSGYPAEAISRFGAGGSDQILLTKPFQSSKLTETIYSVLNGTHPDRSKE